MSTSSRKMGFVDSFMAHNVNISSPDASAKWEALILFIKKNSFELVESYNNSTHVQKLTYISRAEDIPDVLFEFSKCLKLLIESHKDIVKNDPLIYDIVRKFAEVAKSSFDKRVIDMANNLVEILVALRSG